MDTGNDLIFIIVGTAAITAFLAASLAGRTSRPEPQVIYVQTAAPQAEGGIGCLPTVIVIGLIILVLALGG